MGHEPEAEVRAGIVAASRALLADGLTQGTSGNISVRVGEALLITPSGVPPAAMTPESIVRMPLAGEGAFEGSLRPSSEWRLHLALMRERAEFGAIVHAHPPFATALAVTRRPIPPVHYMIAAFGGMDIRCAPYATFGSEALAQAVVRAMKGRRGCLMANHGMLVAGEDLGRAMWLAGELEALARQYVTALQIGGPVLLTEAEIAEALAAFTNYGPRPRHEGGRSSRPRPEE